MTNTERALILRAINDAMALVADVKLSGGYVSPFVRNLEESLEALDEQCGMDVLYEEPELITGYTYTEEEKELIERYREHQEDIPNAIQILVSLPDDLDMEIAKQLFEAAYTGAVINRVVDELEMEAAVGCTDPNCRRCC